MDDNSPRAVKSRSPEFNASWLSWITFWWMWPTLAKAKVAPLQAEDLVHLHPDDETARNAARFAQLPKYFGRGPLRLTLRICWLYRAVLGRAVIISLGFLTGLMGGPLALRALVTDLQRGSFDAALHSGALLVGATALTSFCAHHMFFQVLKLMTQLRSGFSAIIYEKILKLSPEGRDHYASGEIINLLATDVNRIVGTFNFIFSLWMHPLQIVLSLYFLHRILGVVGLAGAALMIIAIAATVVQARLTLRFRKRLLKWSDRRLALLGELLTSIRPMKAYGWEREFASHVAEQRRGEQKEQRKLAIVKAVGGLLYGATPLAAAAASFSAKLLVDGTLTPGDVFGSLGLLMTLRLAVTILPENITAWFEALVSVKRIEKFLSEPEISSISQGNQELGGIELQNATVTWAKGDHALQDCSLVIKPREHVAIVGSVGSGKSTLLAVMAGERTLSSGQVFRNGPCALVTQVSWILNDTVRNNILFGAPFDQTRFDAVLRACQLHADIAQMPAGVDTEIGEQGINLSGGQRQRLALARAAYSNAPIVLLDDPFSALDPQVGKAVCQELLGTWFHGRTVVFVTHRAEFLVFAHRVFRAKAGVVVERPSTTRLASEETEVSEQDVLVEQEGEGAFTEVEERFTGTVNKESITGYYSEYLRFPFGVLFVLVFVTHEIVRMGGDLFLAHSTNHQVEMAQDPWHRFIIPYTLLACGVTLFVFLRAVFSSLRGIAVATTLHDRLLAGITRCPVSFFDRTPRGRILNRFSRDIEQLDSAVPNMTYEVTNCVLGMLFNVGLICVLNPMALLPVSVAAVVYWYAQSIYRPASRESQRLDSITRSPLFAQTTETLHGIAVIRAFDAQDEFLKRMYQRIENNARAFMTMVGCNRWVGVWVEILSVLLVSAVVVLALGRGGMVGNAALVALALNYALGLNGLMNWTLRSLTMLESGLTSAERVQYYAQQPSERYGDAPIEGFLPRGAISFHRVDVRYRADLPIVLNKFSLDVKAGERVGIIGRTGSGKSTLFQVLLRLIEPSGGEILIDGVNTQQVPLEQLRRSLSIIPQDPVVFSGSVRMNLDPFHERTDEELLDILKAVQLSEAIPSLAFELREGGANISFGQRQLLCLGRALARHSKILLLDEATSGVDVHTDAIMQQVIRERFAGCTILAIAHRRETIADYDRIVEIGLRR